MGALADFIAREFAEAPSRPKEEMRSPLVASFAIPASRASENSGNSENSSALRAESASGMVHGESDDGPSAHPVHKCERCNGVAAFGVGCFPTRGIRGRWYCLACLPTEGEG